MALSGLLRPRRGHNISGQARGSHTLLFADEDFLRLLFNGTLLLPAGERARLLLRGSIGTVLVDDFARLPASQRFFTGGDRSVRGFAFETLGPTDADGDNVGGKHLLTGSVEVEWPVVGDWSGAWFVDAGNALDSFSDPLEVSGGVGVRWRSPVGPVRVDLAKPFTEGGKGFRFHLNIGPDL